MQLELPGSGRPRQRPRAAHGFAAGLVPLSIGPMRMHSRGAMAWQHRASPRLPGTWPGTLGAANSGPWHAISDMRAGLGRKPALAAGSGGKTDAIPGLHVPASASHQAPRASPNPTSRLR
jgi:hypothetical protein